MRQQTLPFSTESSFYLITNSNTIILTPCSYNFFKRLFASGLCRLHVYDLILWTSLFISVVTTICGLCIFRAINTSRGMTWISKRKWNRKSNKKVQLLPAPEALGFRSGIFAGQEYSSPRWRIYEIKMNYSGVSFSLLLFQKKKKKMVCR